MAELNQSKVAKIVSLIGKETDSKVRRAVREIFGVKKSRGNEIFNLIREQYAPPLIAKPISPNNTGAIGNKKIVEVKDIESVTTLEDLIAYCKIDTNLWRSTKFVSNVWDNKLQLKAEFQKKFDDQKANALKELIEEIKKVSPKVESFHKKDVVLNDLVLEVVLADVHLGRLCWSPSDGDEYDLKIAKTIVIDAITDIVNKALKFGKYSKVLLWLGGDYLNVDNEDNTTTADTQQSVDSRFPKVFKEGKELLINVINLLKQIAPVDVVITRGNHDLNAMFHMGEVIEAYYHNDKNVVIDNTPKPRKYYHFGEVLIQFSHGDKVDIKKLPTIAAAESPVWSKAKYREIHTAHLHHEKVYVDETSGCKTRIMNTLAGVDNYHNTHGYVKNIRCAQAFIWHKDYGLQTVVYSNPVN